MVEVAVSESLRIGLVCLVSLKIAHSSFINHRVLDLLVRSYNCVVNNSFLR